MDTIKPLDEEIIEEIEEILMMEFGDIQRAHLQQTIQTLYDKYKEFINGD